MTEPLNLLGALLERFGDTSIFFLFSFYNILIIIYYYYINFYLFFLGAKAKRYYTCPSLLPFDIKNFNLKSTKLTPAPLDLTSLSFADDTSISEQQKYAINTYYD